MSYCRHRVHNSNFTFGRRYWSSEDSSDFHEGNSGIRRRRMGGGQGGKGRGRRLLIAVVLRALLERSAHGYELMETLTANFPTVDGPPNSSNVYRLLSELESEGLVSSAWEPGEGGGRRKYQVTEAGKVKLDALIAILREDHKRLGEFLAQLDR